MKILIEIPEEMYKTVKDGLWCGNEIVRYAIEHSTPILDNATNGDVIKALYPNRTFFNEDSCCVTMKEYGKTEEDVEYLTYIDFDGDWWNAPYKGEGE